MGSTLTFTCNSFPPPSGIFLFCDKLCVLFWLCWHPVSCVERCFREGTCSKQGFPCPGQGGSREQPSLSGSKNSTFFPLLREIWPRLRWIWTVSFLLACSQRSLLKLSTCKKEGQAWRAWILLRNKPCSGTGMIPALDLYLATNKSFFSSVHHKFNTYCFDSFSSSRKLFSSICQAEAAHLISHNLPAPMKVKQGFIKNEPTFECKWCYKLVLRSPSFMKNDVYCVIFLLFSFSWKASFLRNGRRGKFTSSFHRVIWKRKQMN